jgi:glycerol-3-phosphate dehydrogenase
MNRDEAARVVRERDEAWDVVVIGGGATGLGAAVDAAARGYSTLLLEQHDFAKGTSSRSTKLIHGGVRYLAQGRLGLVRTALDERERLLRNAPHIVCDRPFLIPAYAWWERPFFLAGLKLYDLLAGRMGRGRSRMLSRGETLERIPTLAAANLRGGILYHDCQFDDARLAIALVRTLFDLGGTALNYAPVAELSKREGRVCGVRARDLEAGEEFDIRARVVINATGVFADRILEMDDPRARPLVRPSQGMHIVLERAFLPSDCAIVVPHTEDRRVLFAIPWHGKTLIGTTDTPVAEPSLEPRPLAGEIGYLLRHAGRYLSITPTRSDVLSVFAGLRPLVAGRSSQRTAAVSRDHRIEVTPSGLVTIAGGKWTTYRHMGETVVDVAVCVGKLSPAPSKTRDLRLHGWRAEADARPSLSVYGSDAEAVRGLAAAQSALGELLHPRLPYLKAEVVWAARHEMARTVEDVLSRRTRALLLDAKASFEAAWAVAELLAAELGRSAAWKASQVAEFESLARGYLPD